MTSNRTHLVLPRTTPAEALTRELQFVGDGVHLAGQIDYPVKPVPSNGFPLLFLLHHATYSARADYADYADLALETGYAVFRWDKRGTGRSGAGGRGSTTQDAADAYDVALQQPQVNRRRVIIAALGAGTALLGSAFGLFARLQQPHAVLLIANMLDERAILAVNAPIYIVAGEHDWNAPREYATAAAQAHAVTYPYGAEASIVRDSDRMLNVAEGGLHPDARKGISEWLLHIQRTQPRSPYI